MSDPRTSPDLGTRILSGARWVALLRLTAQLFSWVSTIIVVRFISPEDYGLNAMLEAPMELLMLFSTLGLDAALVQSRKIEHDQLQSAFGWLLAINFILFLLYFFGGAVLAEYFNEPRLAPLAKALSIVFLLAPFRAIPNALLDRELKFKAKAVVELVAAVAAAIVTLTLAVMGAGVWALIAGLVLNRVIIAVLLMALHPWFVRPTLGPAAAQMIAFGGIVALSGGVLLLSSKLVSLISGPALGAKQLGIYAVAMQFALLPLAKVMPVINPIMFPAFSRLQGHPEQAGYYLEKSISVAALLLFPIMVGLACVAPGFVRVVLGDGWGPVALPLALISVIMPLRMVTSFVRPVMNGMGRPDLTLKSSFLMLILLLPIIPVMERYGVVGLAMVWVISEPIVTFATVRMSKKVIGISFRRTMRGLMPALTATALMAAVVLLTREGTDLVDTGGELALEVAIGAATYLLTLYLLFRSQSREAIGLLFGRSPP